jgi:hypothetical protein
MLLLLGKSSFCHRCCFLVFQTSLVTKQRYHFQCFVVIIEIAAQKFCSFFSLFCAHSPPHQRPNKQWAAAVFVMKMVMISVVGVHSATWIWQKQGLNHCFIGKRSLVAVSIMLGCFSLCSIAASYFLSIHLLWSRQHF